MDRKKANFCLAVVCGVIVAPSAMALPILTGVTADGGQTWTASDLDGRSGQAVFAGTAGGFTIQLSSLALSTSQPNELLAGLIFDFEGGSDPVILNPATDGLVNVTAAAIGDQGTSLLSKYGVDHGLNLDGEWGARNDLDGPSGGLGNYGIAGTAYDPLGISIVIDPTVAYTPPVSTNGAEFAIASGDTSGLVSSISFWAIDSVTIEFATSGAFDFGDLDRVSFLYGTSFDTVSVPEPATLGLLGVGLIGIALMRRRRRDA